MIEEILIPMRCLYDIPSLNEMSMPSYKAGDIFLFNPFHEVHVELDEHGCFQELENKLCDFICQYPQSNINGNIYNVGDKIASKDIENTDEDVIRNLCYIGYIQKVVKKENKKPSVKNNKTSKAKKTNAETYTTIARKFAIDKDMFKKRLLDELGIEVKDMRKKVPLNLKKKIIKLLGE